MAIVRNKRDAAALLLAFIAHECSTDPELQRSLANAQTDKHATNPGNKLRDDQSHRNATALHLAAAMSHGGPLMTRLLQCAGLFDANLQNKEMR